MKVGLKDVISGVDPRRIVGEADIHVADIVLDSRKATPGSLFICIRGSRVDGAAFSEDAARRGASAILTEKEISLSVPVTQIIVSDVRRALAIVSSNFFGRPSEHLTVVGVTGTNGKTTTVHYIRSILEAAGHTVGVMGTLGHWLGGTYEKDAFTTPEAPEVQRYMRRMVDGGAEYCVMEVSSHAIALRRVDEVAFKVIAFTNLTRDHLD
jgi:UDP-N-acetylmuramoyl-L-alanyl-D-glutamate--2,6-diaminopimelate ligase